ncbi:MAG TPA: hypothetical protein VGI10_23070 [Polyangiaceae bacterium]|jgi:hypothetical protein
MSDPERPKGPAAFEVPDLDVGAPAPPPRSVSPSTHRKPANVAAGGLFEEDAFTSGSVGIELSDAAPFSEASHSAYMGAEIDLGLGGEDFELEPSTGFAQPSSSGVQSTRRASDGERWPTGKELPPEQLRIDPAEVARLASFGEPPRSPLTAPLYTYRVLARKRELRQRLLRLEVARKSAESERESALVSLSEHVRPELEKTEQFRRLLEPLAAIDRLAEDRSQALASTNTEYGSALAGYDAELAKLADMLLSERSKEQVKRGAFEERDASNRRAEAKFKRVQIEIRAVNQVVQQKLGPQGGRIPEQERLQLDELSQRGAALEPELNKTRQELEQAQRELAETVSSIENLRRSERQLTRQKQALSQQFGKQLAAQSQDLTDADARRRATLAEVGVAVLAMRGTIAVPKELLAAVRSADQKAELLQHQAAAELSALDAFNRSRYRQGFVVTLSALSLLVLLIVLKMLASSTSTP